MGNFYIFLLLTKVSARFLSANVCSSLSKILTFSFADGSVAACVDVLQITHAAISMVNFFPDWLITYSSAPAFVYFLFLFGMIFLMSFSFVNKTRMLDLVLFARI